MSDHLGDTRIHLLALEGKWEVWLDSSDGRRICIGTGDAGEAAIADAIVELSDRIKGLIELAATLDERRKP